MLCPVRQAFIINLLAIPPHLFWSILDIGHSDVTMLELANHAPEM